MDVPSLKAQVRELVIELKETKKELEKLKRKYDERIGLQDCLYCEIEMKPRHWKECEEYIDPATRELKVVENPYAFLKEEEELQIHHRHPLHQMSSILG